MHSKNCFSAPHDFRKWSQNWILWFWSSCAEQALEWTNPKDPRTIVEIPNLQLPRITKLKNVSCCSISREALNAIELPPWTSMEFSFLKSDTQTSVKLQLQQLGKAFCFVICALSRVSQGLRIVCEYWDQTWQEAIPRDYVAHDINSWEQQFAPIVTPTQAALGCCCPKTQVTQPPPLPYTLIAEQVKVKSTSYPLRASMRILGWPPTTNLIIYPAI